MEETNTPVIVERIFKDEVIPKERTQPWITEGALLLLEHFFWKFRAIQPPIVLETGMGASTKYLYDRCKILVSIEHDKEWYDKIVCGIPVHPFTFFLSNRPYNNIIDSLPDNGFDLILIDGRDRVKCIQSAIPKLKSGGWLILDNSERPYYQKGIDLMKDWNRIDCKQNRPDKYDFTYPDWTTSIFIKP